MNIMRKGREGLTLTMVKTLATAQHLNCWYSRCVVASPSVVCLNGLLSFITTGLGTELTDL